MQETCLTPLLNMASTSQNSGNLQANINPLGLRQENVYTPQQKRMLASGGKGTKEV